VNVSSSEGAGGAVAMPNLLRRLSEEYAAVESHEGAANSALMMSQIGLNLKHLDHKASAAAADHGEHGAHEHSSMEGLLKQMKQEVIRSRCPASRKSYTQFFVLTIISPV